MNHPVLFAINNLDTAGMKHVVASIIRKIDKSRFSPHIIVNRKSESVLEKELSGIATISVLKLRSEGIFKTLFLSGDKTRMLKQSAPILHDFDYSSDYTGAWLARRAGIYYVAEKTNLSFDSWRWKFKLGMATHIVCLSAAQQKLLAPYASKLTMIPVGVDIQKYSKASSYSRPVFGLSDEDVVLVSVAHLVPVKGYEELIEAVAMISGKFPSLKVIVVGEGESEYTKWLKSHAREKGVIDRFIFTGLSDHVAEWLQMADGKILATRNKGRKEAFGTALVEAMVAGKPVIATRSGGPEEIVVDNETGFLVDADSPETLAEGIERFMHAKARWKEMGKAGYERALALYNEEKMVRAYESVYEKMLGV